MRPNPPPLRHRSPSPIRKPRRASSRRTTAANRTTTTRTMTHCRVLARRKRQTSDTSDRQQQQPHRPVAKPNLQLRCNEPKRPLDHSRRRHRRSRQLNRRQSRKVSRRVLLIPNRAAHRRRPAMKRTPHHLGMCGQRFYENIIILIITFSSATAATRTPMTPAQTLRRPANAHRPLPNVPPPPQPQSRCHVQTVTTAINSHPILRQPMRPLSPR